MDFSFFKGKKITVYGLGLHGGGVGVVRFLLAKGAKVIVTDSKNEKQLASSLEKLKGLKNVQYVLGCQRVEDFANVDMVIKNPAIAWDDKYIQLALKKKVPVEMDSSLFFKLCKNKIIGVTGTKGKTTTTTLICEMLKNAGKNPLKVGVGQVSVLDKLALLKKNSVVVFELSSWRLAGLGRAKLSPQIAVFSNFLPDHLNYYGTMKKYWEDKRQIFANQKAKDFLVLNFDDEKLREIAQQVHAKTIAFSIESVEKTADVFVENGNIFLRKNGELEKLLATKNIKLLGQHNLANVLAAIGAVSAFGLGTSEIKKALPNLKGPAHRLELVREIAGVKFFNDTAATIPQATLSALEVFAGQRVILIAGGADKNLDFVDFGKVVAKQVAKLILFEGRACEKMLVQLEKTASKDFLQNVEIVDSMEKAVLLARKHSSKGSIVLLSPGAASFGLFANEFDRGDKFKKIVGRL